MSEARHESVSPTTSTATPGAHPTGMEALLADLYNPMEQLAGRIRSSGGALAWEEAHGYVLRSALGTVIATGQDLAELLRALDCYVPKQRGIRVKLQRPLLLALRSVLNVGESRGAFVRAALRAEVARRQAEEAPELLYADPEHGGAPCCLSCYFEAGINPVALGYVVTTGVCWSCEEAAEVAGAVAHA